MSSMAISNLAYWMRYNLDVSLKRRRVAELMTGAYNQTGCQGLGGVNTFTDDGSAQKYRQLVAEGGR